MNGDHYAKIPNYRYKNFVQIYQAALFINTECRGFDALKFMGKRMNQLKKKMVESKQKQPWDLVEDFYGKIRHFIVRVQLVNMGI